MPKFRLKLSSEPIEFSAKTPMAALDIWASISWGGNLREDAPEEWLKHAATSASDWDGKRYHFQSEKALVNDLLKNGLLEIIEWYDGSNAGTGFNDENKKSIKQREISYV